MYCKRFIPYILILLLSMNFLISCGKTGLPANGNSDNKLNIVTTIFAPFDFAREITGDKADITMLLPPASESHSYEPAPQDIIKIQNCDVFIYVGGESDEWIKDILKSMNTDHMKIITLMDCIDTVEEEIVEGMEDNEAEEEHAAYDEHVWTSPKNAKRIVQKISDVLCGADEGNASVYKQNTESYIKKLDDLDAAFQSVTDHAKRKTIVFGDRFPFRYFADTYGLDYFAAFPGCSAETEPSAATITFLVDKIKKEKIPVVFHAELSNKRMAETISEATGAKVMLLHACHNISKTDFENGVSYLELMNKNLNSLKEALY